MNRETAKALAMLRQDNRNGASYLTGFAAEIVREALHRGETDALEEIAKNIAASHPAMASLYRFAQGVMEAGQRGGKREVEAFCHNFLVEFRENGDRAVANAVEHLRGKRRFLTHSHSSLVRKALLKLGEKGDLRVICTESRPMGEGVELAESLCEAGIETALVVDALAASLLKEVDALLLGADGVGEFGLMHKAGTYPLALAAAAAGVPVLSIVTKEKWWPKGTPLPSEFPRPAEEVAHTKCASVINRYFDLTPLRLVDAFITEAGVLAPDEASGRYVAALHHFS